MISYLEERTRILPIVAACELSGDWGDGFGATPFEFIVDGALPNRCPNCQATLAESESPDSGDWNTEFWLSCDPCGLVWHNGNESIT